MPTSQWMDSQEIMDEAVLMQQELGDDQLIYIIVSNKAVGANIMRYCHEFGVGGKASVLTPGQVKSGALRGRKGVVFIHDLMGATDETKTYVLSEQARVNAAYVPERG